MLTFSHRPHQVSHGLVRRLNRCTIMVVASSRPFCGRRRGFIGWLPSGSASVKVYAGLDHRPLRFPDRAVIFIETAAHPGRMVRQGPSSVAASVDRAQMPVLLAVGVAWHYG
jgi:hypothetical protein